MAIVIAVAVSLLASIIAAEMYSVMPTVTDFLLRIATRRLSGTMKERCFEEWRAQLADVPSPLLRLLHAASLIARANAVLQEDIAQYFRELDADIAKLIAIRNEAAVERRKLYTEARITCTAARVKFALARLFVIAVVVVLSKKLLANNPGLLRIRAKLPPLQQSIKQFQKAVLASFKLMDAKDAELKLAIQKLRAEKQKATADHSHSPDYDTKLPLVAADLRRRLSALVVKTAIPTDTVKAAIKNIRDGFAAFKATDPVGDGTKG